MASIIPHTTYYLPKASSMPDNAINLTFVIRNPITSCHDLEYIMSYFFRVILSTNGTPVKAVKQYYPPLPIADKSRYPISDIRYFKI